MDARRRSWLAVDVGYYDSNLAVAIRKRCGIVGLTVFDAFLRACKRNSVEGQVTYGSEPDFLAQVGLSCAQLVDEAGDKWDLSTLWRVTGEHHSTACRRSGHRTTVVARRWDDWQIRRSDGRNTDTMRKNASAMQTPTRTETTTKNSGPVDNFETADAAASLNMIRAERLRVVGGAKAEQRKGAEG